MWRNTRRTFDGYNTFNYDMANTQTPMLRSVKSISQRTKLTQTSLISCPIHNVATMKVKTINNASDYKCRANAFHIMHLICDNITLG